MRDPFSPGSAGKLRSATRTEERRRSERHPFSAVADVTEPSSNAGISVRISDLGLHGCYADSLTVFPIGTVVKLSIQHSGSHIDTLARVVYAKTGMGMGLNFQDPSVETQAMLREWLAVSKGAAASAKPPVEFNSEIRSPDAPPEPLPAQARKEKLVVTRLIELMMYKGQLTELEGRELLKQLQQER